jgi:hypothetical protein
MEKARSIPGIVDIGVNYKIGDFVPINESSLHRTAWVISESDTREGAIALCEKALNLMKFITE